jgi:hypothetical protein
MAERNLPGEPDQDVQPDADDGGEPDQHDDVEAIAVAGRDERRGGDDDGRHDGGVRSHTLRTRARPNKPSGRSASAAMMSANVTIWV